MRTERNCCHSPLQEKSRELTGAVYVCVASGCCDWERTKGGDTNMAAQEVPFALECLPSKVGVRRLARDKQQREMKRTIDFHLFLVVWVGFGI